jgi:hypothetical protein
MIAINEERRLIDVDNQVNSFLQDWTSHAVLIGWARMMRHLIFRRRIDQ